MSGYIKLHRGWSDASIFGKSEPFCKRAAWAWLLEKAAWKDGERRDSHGNIVPIKRGQLHTSARTLGGIWGWSKNKAERFLRDLETCQMVDRTTDRHGVLLTISNYEKYQGRRTTDGPQNGSGTDQSRTTQEEGKERKEEKNYAFAGRVIRLTFEDLSRWKRAFPDLDLMAVLTARDDWLAGQPEADRKRWFPSTSSYLAKQQQLAFERRPPKEPVIGI